MKPQPMLLDGETALLLRLGRKTERRWPLPWPDQHVLPLAMADRGARAEHGAAGEPTGRWGWTDPEGNFYAAPIGGPGTVVYVRESFTIVTGAVAKVAATLGMDPVQDPESKEWAVARSAVAARLVGAEGARKGEPLSIGTCTVERWSSAIHMPRWAASQYLRVEALYLHRLHVITPAEVRAEGLAGVEDGAATLALWPPFWDARNPGAKWEMNPMVAAVRFRPLTLKEAQDAGLRREEVPAGARKGRGKRGRKADPAAGGDAAAAGGEVGA